MSPPTPMPQTMTTTPAEIDSRMRQAVAGLLAWQLHPHPRQVEDAAADAAALQTFFDAWGAKAPPALWGEREQAACQRVLQALLNEAARAPRVALRCEPVREGPLSHDLAALLRPPHEAWDEPQELDWAVRYWQAARQAGLLDEQLGADFGDFWRRLEWSGLQQHLAWLGAGHGEQRLLLAQVVKVVSRYAELAPVKRLLQSTEPELFDAGFTLR